MNEVIELINKFVGYDNFSIQDFKFIKEYLEDNKLDTNDIDKFIGDISERCSKFITELSEQFNSLSEDQVKSIDILNKNNIKWELKSDWNYNKQGYIYTIVVDSKEEDE